MYNIVNNDEIINDLVNISNEKLTAALAIYSITDSNKTENYKKALKYCIEALNSFKYILKFYKNNEEIFEYIMECFEILKLFFSHDDKGFSLILHNEKKYIEKFVLLKPKIFDFSNKDKYPFTNYALDNLYNKN